MDIRKGVARFRRLWMLMRIIAFFPVLAVFVICGTFLLKLATPEYLADYVPHEQIAKSSPAELALVPMVPLILMAIGAYGWKKCGLGMCAAVYAACALSGFSLPTEWVATVQNAANPWDAAISVLVRMLVVLAALGALATYFSLFRKSAMLAGKSPFQITARFSEVVRARRSSFRSLRLQRLYIIPAAIVGIALAQVALWNIFGIIVVHVLPSDLITQGTMEEFKRQFAARPLPMFALAAMQLVWIVAVLVIIVAGVRLARRVARRRADELVRAPDYRPIVLLRSFQDEDRRVTPKSAIYRLTTRGKRLEEAVVAALSPLGPAVAIGLPSERLPRLGAYRAYYDDASWQHAFEDWVARSLLVVVIVGTTPWSVWEMGYLMRGSFGGKLIAVLPPSSDEERAGRQTALQGAAAGTPWEAAASACDYADVSVLAFNADGSIAAIRGGGRSEAGIELALMAAIQPQAASAVAAG